MAFKVNLLKVILNVLSNSKDAFNERNTLKPKIDIKIKQDDCITIEIMDNAGGIDDNILDKVFEPYFTTKLYANGVGIGLYMSKIIIEKNMDGQMMMENRFDGVKTVITFKDNN